ncbi:MAG TPA: zinc-binding dehydrogenase [Aggregatilineaceae bacterium]|nr:zinc-binding dehydrogenase [Aggregatilineaceae bacterium]
MRQILITKAGTPDVLRVVEAPVSEPTVGRVRIKVAAAGVNFADVMGRLGLYPDAPRIPYVPGYEVAGVVDAVGEGVDAGLTGQDVIALTRFGGYSEYAWVPAIQVFPRPARFSVEQAAGFPVAYLTAYATLVALAGIKHGEHVLVHAAAGGVGLAAVDICRIFGATVYGTASPQKHDFLRERGVQYPIDYRHQDFEKEIKRLTKGKGVQIALDPIGGHSWTKSYRSLSPGGRLVMCGVFSLAPKPNRSLWAAIKLGLTIPWLRFNPISLTSDNKGVLGLNIGKLWDRQEIVRQWVDQLVAWQDNLNVHVDRVFRFEEAAEAHRYMQERRNIGKVILVP